MQRTAPALAIACLLFAGCVSTPRVAGADRVLIVLDRTGMPPAQPVGDAMGYCGNWWVSWLLENEFQYENAMNMLRNQAVRLGGDHVLVRQIEPNASRLMFMGTVYRSEQPAAR